MDWIGQPPGVGQGLMSLGNANGGMGYAAPGDPNVTGGSLSPGAYDRAINSMGVSGLSALGRAGVNALTGYAAGMPANMIGNATLSSVMSPASVLGFVTDPVKAALGISPDALPGKIASKAATFGLGMLGGPIGGLLGGLLGDFAIDGIMDGLDLRSDEKRRDQYENDWGYSAGRAAHKDKRDIEKAGLAVNGIQNVKDALPNSMAAMQAVDRIINQTSRLEAAMHNRMGTPNPGLSNRDAQPTYGGFGSIGGPLGGAYGVDPGYGPSMGGWAGLGIGNVRSYGGRDSSGRGHNVGGERGSSTGTGGGYNDGRGGVTGL